jgi:hypothetical protein
LVDETDVSAALLNLGWSALGLDDHALAADSFRESLSVARRLGAVGRIADSAEGLAAALIAGHQEERGAQLLGAAAALRHEIEMGARDDHDEQVHDRALADAQAALGDAAFAEAWTRGEAMTAEEIVAFSEAE